VQLLGLAFKTFSYFCDDSFFSWWEDASKGYVLLGGCVFKGLQFIIEHADALGLICAFDEGDEMRFGDVFALG
jgi:hypothetical protein